MIRSLAWCFNLPCHISPTHHRISSHIIVSFRLSFREIGFSFNVLLCCSYLLDFILQHAGQVNQVQQTGIGNGFICFYGVLDEFNLLVLLVVLLCCM